VNSVDPSGICEPTPIAVRKAGDLFFLLRRVQRSLPALHGSQRLEDPDE